MDAISQTTFSNAFPWIKMHELCLRLHWSLFIWFELTIFQHWFRWWLGAGQATSYYLNQWWLVYQRIYASLGLNELIFPLSLINDDKHVMAYHSTDHGILPINDFSDENIWIQTPRSSRYMYYLRQICARLPDFRFLLYKSCSGSIIQVVEHLYFFLLIGVNR